MSCLTVFSAVPAFADDADNGQLLDTGANSGNIEDPDAAAGILNEFCKARVKTAGGFSDEEAAELREMLFDGQYSDKMPAGMHELPDDVMDRFVKEVLRCAVTADTVRLMQNSSKKTKTGMGVR
ncbi:MAG: hypothetical protein HZB82_00675 [Deltaproteobacteria bacterium]|nr:hypothetical protein [Deltaproteobacteria bacterium]